MNGSGGRASYARSNIISLVEHPASADVLREVPGEILIHSSAEPHLSFKLRSNLPARVVQTQSG